MIELCSGGSLRDRIEAAPLSVEAVRQLGIQIAGALEAAHAASVLHRDIKPANLLCTETGTWKLADFGIARLPDSKLTITGQFLGSPSYAAPESLRAGEFTPASDVYGLGATLYEALTGAPPHGEHDLASLIRKLDHDPIPLRDKVTVGDAIEAAIMGALAKDPARRPTAAQLAHLLATDQAPVVARPTPPRSRRLLLGVIGALALAILLAVAIAGRGTSPSAASVDMPATDGTPVQAESSERVLDPLEPDDQASPHGHGHKKHKDHHERDE
ncbi:hypothetical protein BH11MYX1_BH11MYX1_28050 [soil metagenome]